MIQRVVFVRLKENFRSADVVAQIAERTPSVLMAAHGVLDVKVGVCADTRTGEAWDFSILVTFASMEDVNLYRDDVVHRAYADELLKPIQEKIRVYNFRVVATSSEQAPAKEADLTGEEPVAAADGQGDE